MGVVLGFQCLHLAYHHFFSHRDLKNQLSISCLRPVSAPLPESSVGKPDDRTSMEQKH